MNVSKESVIYRGNLVDVVTRSIFPAEVEVKNTRIVRVTKVDETLTGFIIPGFIDSHIHIESSMLSPLEFSRMAMKHGTVAVVSDPHEIANVLGEEGVHFMVENSRLTPMKILFGAPSCVPATSFETSGANIDLKSIEGLLELDEVGYLSEMMNFPGVIYDDKEVWDKIKLAHERQIPIDGHAPGLKGEQLEKYAAAGISTDHECFTIDEAKEKIRNGMHIQIREGSGAKNYEALKSLVSSNPESIMYCSDDLHPDDLMKGHINLIVKRAIKEGFDLFDVLRACSYNPVKHYNLDVGLLQPDDPADFVLLDSLEDFNVQKTIINGKVCFDGNKVFTESSKIVSVNKFSIQKICEKDIQLVDENSRIRIIEALDGELITKSFFAEAFVENGKVVSNLEKDILKLVVVNRYNQTKPSIAFIKGFGLKKGAIASSIAHDSHNIICVGCSDEAIVATINDVIENKGAVVTNLESEIISLPLAIAGIMSDDTCERVASKYDLVNHAAFELGSELKAPFMTLAFMALLVIPELKLSDKGLFDGNSFSFVSVFENN